MVQQSPLAPQEAMNMAARLEADNRQPEAEALYRRILEAHPGFHPAYHGLGLLAYHAGKLPLAVDLIARAIKLNGQVPAYHRDLGEMSRRLGRLNDAVVAAMRAIALNDGDVDAHYNLGLALGDRNDYRLALESYRQALQINPNHGLAMNNMGSMLQKLEDNTGAEKAYRKAVAINKHHAEAQNNLGTLLSMQGKLDEARSCLETALEERPQFIAALHQLSALKRYTEDDPQLATLESLANRAPELPPEESIKLHFALGKARDDAGRYEQAFAAYAEGNRLHRATLPDNEAKAEAQANSIIEHFDRTFFEQFEVCGTEVCGTADNTPVFIVGMPRSGTTLTEQILSSHPGVYGAGELKELHQLVNDFAQGKPFAEAASALSAADFTSLGEEYVAKLRDRPTDATHITDKMPANFFYIGLIHLALPNAKIIHTMRDPMDSCLSNYMRLFNDTMEFTYDLGTLGRYYVRYMKLMQHWHSVLPKGTILNVRYEDMVADTEGQTRRMLEHLGLPWDDNCLEFYNNKREVKTASLAQVRQPIYNSSVAGWKRFATQLQPLQEIVQAYREPVPATEPSAEFLT